MCGKPCQTIGPRKRVQQDSICDTYCRLDRYRSVVVALGEYERWAESRNLVANSAKEKSIKRARAKPRARAKAKARARRRRNRHPSGVAAAERSLLRNLS